MPENRIKLSDYQFNTLVTYQSDIAQLERNVEIARARMVDAVALIVDAQRLNLSILDDGEVTLNKDTRELVIVEPSTEE